MKTKVLKYANDGNTLVMPYMEIAPIEGINGAFYSTFDDNYNGQYFYLIIEVNGFFINEGSYPIRLLSESKLLDAIPPFIEGFLNRWQVANWVQSLDIRLHELLGIDTAPLLARRAEIIASREAKKEIENAEKKRILLENAAKQTERLNNVFNQFKAGEKISLSDFIELIRVKNIPMHPRSMGMLNKLHPNSQIGEKSASLGGKKTISRQTFDSVFKIAETLAAA